MQTSQTTKYPSYPGTWEVKIATSALNREGSQTERSLASAAGVALSAASYFGSPKRQARGDYVPGLFWAGDFPSSTVFMQSEVSLLENPLSWFCVQGHLELKQSPKLSSRKH